MQEPTLIFSDGASRGNPGPGGWGAIVSHAGIVTELGGGEKYTTNNRMELLGAIEALHHAKGAKNIIVHTDSSYVINGITKWVKGWQKNHWQTKMKTDVTNRDLWEALVEASTGKDIIWQYVPGHAGVLGNERCDEIATTFADGEKPELFSGKVSAYKIDLSDIGAKKVVKKSSSKKSGPAYSYLSLVHGILHIDKTWAACEKRVKGVKGDVKFKKALSATDEKKIIAEWGK